MNSPRRLVVRPGAIQEVRDAFVWYASRDEALAERFQATIEQAVAEIHAAPLR